MNASQLPRRVGRFVPSVLATVLLAGPTSAATGQVRVVGRVIDTQNGLTLPGTTVEVTPSGASAPSTSTSTNVEGAFAIDLVPGSYSLGFSLQSYKTRTVSLQVQSSSLPSVDVGMTLESFAEVITVTAATDAVSSSAEAQLSERKHAPVISDNLGADDMKASGDGDAAAALARVTGLSIVDNQYVYVRGLGERYSNTTLGGSVLPTTEPDRKVVPLDLFPSGLIDGVSIAKTYLPDRSAEFAGGLVQISPLKLPNRRVLQLSLGGAHSSTATGKSIPLSPLGTDRFGFDSANRGLPAAFPPGKIVRAGIYSPEVGFGRERITALGRALDNRWQPQNGDGALGQSGSFVYGDRFGKLGLVASLTQGFKQTFVEEDRRFFRLEEGGELEAVSDYQLQTAVQKAHLAGVFNLGLELSPSHRLSVQNFYTHSGTDEGRFFEGPNTENNFIYRNSRLRYLEEELISSTLGGEHFLDGLSKSSLDWRVTFARASRDEPDLRETLYQQACVAGTGCSQGSGAFLLADESQSGFRLFNDLQDDSVDAAANWSLVPALGRSTILKFGGSFAHRTRDFQSRRFRFIPITANTGGSVGVDLSQTPEQLFAEANIGLRFRFNEETRPVDAYAGKQDTIAGYAMADVALGERLRLVGGARVERFEQEVDTFDPFGLFAARIRSSNEATDVFPGVNAIVALGPDTNLRLSGSITANRPEFRELAPFEFTDVVGNRAVRGNPELRPAEIRNLDARLERITGGRDVLAASVFYKDFSDPIERVVIAGAQPIVTFQNSDSARNFGVELEAARQLGSHFFLGLNYTFVDSKITLLPEQRSVQTSLERPLAGQSKHVFNSNAELTIGGFSTRLLYNYFADRISDVGANQAPDIVEQGRGTLDAVFSQRFGRLNLRLELENLTDTEWLFTQGDREQRVFKLGRSIALSVGVDAF